MRFFSWFFLVCCCQLPVASCQATTVLQKGMRGAEFFSRTVSIALVSCLVFVNILDMFNTYYLQK